MSEVVSQRDGGWGWQGGQEIDFRMKVDHDWSPDTRLQDYTS